MLQFSHCESRFRNICSIFAKLVIWLRFRQYYIERSSGCETGYSPPRRMVYDLIKNLRLCGFVASKSHLPRKSRFSVQAGCKDELYRDGFLWLPRSAILFYPIPPPLPLPADKVTNHHSIKEKRSWSNVSHSSHSRLRSGSEKGNPRIFFYNTPCKPSPHWSSQFKLLKERRHHPFWTGSRWFSYRSVAFSKWNLSLISKTGNLMTETPKATVQDILCEKYSKSK